MNTELGDGRPAVVTEPQRVTRIMSERLANLLPEELHPVDGQRVLLPGGARVDLPKTTPTFRRWHGKPPDDTFGGKPVLDVDGSQEFAELVILRMLQRAGWDGVWIDTYRRRYRSQYWGSPSDVKLPPQSASRLAAISNKHGKQWSGAFDVFAWHEEGDFIFAESKRRAHDRIRVSQRHWVQAALEVGIAPERLLIVEWDLRD